MTDSIKFFSEFINVPYVTYVDFFIEMPKIINSSRKAIGTLLRKYRRLKRQQARYEEEKYKSRVVPR